MKNQKQIIYYFILSQKNKVIFNRRLLLIKKETIPRRCTSLRHVRKSNQEVLTWMMKWFETQSKFFLLLANLEARILSCVVADRISSGKPHEKRYMRQSCLPNGPAAAPVFRPAVRGWPPTGTWMHVQTPSFLLDDSSKYRSKAYLRHLMHQYCLLS